jgi:hypothetical protein
LIILLSIPFAMTGSVWLLWIMGYHLSIAVWVGIIALAGLAAQTGTVMIIYLDEAFHAYQRAGRTGRGGRGVVGKKRKVQDGDAGERGGVGVGWGGGRGRGEGGERGEED